MYTPIASSPLAVRHSTSLKQRTSISARGTATTAPPRPTTNGSSSLHGGSLLEFLSGSVSSRRSVSSSPTEGSRPSGCGGGGAPAPAQAIHGFAVSEAAAPAPACPRAAARGLLSRALGGGPGEAAMGVCSTQAGSEPNKYFPEVETGLLRDLQERHPVFYTDLVVTAYMLTAKAHAGQQRKDGTSQLSHCVMVALQLAEMGLDAETVAAGLLHEALRYTPGFRPQMEEFMPGAVVQLVDRVTTISEISHLYRNNPSALEGEKMRRMLLAMEDVKAVLIKLACRVHNLATISALPRDKQLSFAQETLDIFAVVANRLGIWSLKAQLEDLAFAVLHPEEAEALQAQVSLRQDPAALEATIHSIKAALDERGVKYEDISGRPKNLYGIWTKMQKGGLSSLDSVYDVVALRLVVTNKADCYVALRCVQELYKSMPGRSKDYIKDPKKPNGYQSLHETIYGEGELPVEVQIRTHKMHYIAEFGFAAHWKYKEKLSNEDEWLDKEVQYKKWLTNYKLGLNDRKVRAAGAPQHETALTSLGMHLLGDSLDGGEPGDLPGVDPFLRHDRFRLQAPAKQHVAVVVQTQDSIDTRELGLEVTAAVLARELSVDQLPGYVMTINQRVPSPSYVLRSGDLVQVVPEARLPAAIPARSTSPLRPAGISPRHSAPMPGATRRVAADRGGRDGNAEPFAFTRLPQAAPLQLVTGFSVTSSPGGGGQGTFTPAGAVGSSIAALPRGLRSSSGAGSGGLPPTPTGSVRRRVASVEGLVSVQQRALKAVSESTVAA